MKTRKLTLMSLFIALSFLGANIKIMQTIAFDSMPAFLGALILGPICGAVIGAVGHFLTAFTSGFPFGFPVHLIIMVNMALTMYAYGLTYKAFSKKNKYIATFISGLVGVVINGPISILMIIPILGKGMIAMVPVLCLAAFINILIAEVVHKFLPESVKQWKSEKLGI